MQPLRGDVGQKAHGTEGMLVAKEKMRQCYEIRFDVWGGKFVPERKI